LSERDTATSILCNALVAPRQRIVYVPTPKIACTSIKWALAERESSPRRRARLDTSGEQSRELTIHERSVHGLASLHALPPDERESILRDSAWVRFCVVRDPYERLISGWVDQWLLGRRHGVAHPEITVADGLSDAPFDVGSEFRKTVRALKSETELLADRHFRPQRDTLDPEHFPYTHVVNVTNLDEFNREVAASDPARARLKFRRRNAGIRFSADALYDRATGEIVDEVFAEDFATFGLAHRTFAESPPPVLLSLNERAMIRMIRLRNERIADVSAVARGERREPSRLLHLTHRARLRLTRRSASDR
jgi:hypothetical protein